LPAFERRREWSAICTALRGMRMRLLTAIVVVAPITLLHCASGGDGSLLGTANNGANVASDADDKGEASNNSPPLPTPPPPPPPWPPPPPSPDAGAPPRDAATTDAPADAARSQDDAATRGTTNCKVKAFIDNNHFKVLAVSGRTITADVTFKDCGRR